MLIKLSKNIYRSFLRFVLLTALIHIGVLVFRVVKEGDIKLLNYFGILDLNAFFPHITKGWRSDVWSIVLMTTIFSLILGLSFIKKRKKLMAEIKVKTE